MYYHSKPLSVCSRGLRQPSSHSHFRRNELLPPLLEPAVPSPARALRCGTQRQRRGYASSFAWRPRPTVMRASSQSMFVRPTKCRGCEWQMRGTVVRWHGLTGRANECAQGGARGADWCRELADLPVKRERGREREREGEGEGGRGREREGEGEGERGRRPCWSR
jgi:hypothetical protein